MVWSKWISLLQGQRKAVRLVPPHLQHLRVSPFSVRLRTVMDPDDIPDLQFEKLHISDTMDSDDVPAVPFDKLLVSDIQNDELGLFIELLSSPEVWQSRRSLRVRVSERRGRR